VSVVDLGRPRTAGDILSGTFGLFFARAPLFLTLTLAVVAPFVVIVDGIWGGGLADAADANVPYGAGAISALGTAFLLPPLVTALHVVAVQALGRGEEPDIGGAFRRAAPAFVPAVLVVLLYALAVVVGFVLLVIPGIWLSVRWYFGAQAVAAEARRGTDAFSRSEQLVQGNWWRVFGILLLIGLIAGIPIAIVSAGVDQIGSGPLYVTARVLVTTIQLSITALAGTLLFFDLRVRKEPPPAAEQLLPGGFLPPTAA
jgi:hypothetical protein